MKFKTLRLCALLSFTYQLQPMESVEYEADWRPEKPIIDHAINTTFRWIFDISEEITTHHGYPREKETISAKYPRYVFKLSRHDTKHIVTSVFSPDEKTLFFLETGNGSWIIPQRQLNNTCSISEINRLQCVLTAALDHTDEDEINCLSFYKTNVSYHIRRTTDGSINLQRLIQSEKKQSQIHQ